ncbi:MAG: hypothetical protein P1V51_23370 [Deltaproteobacteria bacterium]|nr:hypothetical protein [Deltaproteobacteria bacterium]
MVSRWIALAGLMLVALPACDGGGEGSDGGSDDGGGGSCYPYLLIQDHEEI